VSSFPCLPGHAVKYEEIRFRNLLDRFSTVSWNSSSCLLSATISTTEQVALTVARVVDENHELVGRILYPAQLSLKMSF